MKKWVKNFRNQKKLQKRLLLPVFAVLMSFVLVGCESETQVRCASISDITGALSTDYAIKVVLDEDERVEDKWVGMQIRSDVQNLTITFGEELGDDYTLTLTKSDYWYNLTYLISQTNGVNAEAGYLKYPEYGNRVFRFTTDEDATLTFRMVVGKTKTNEDTGEEILVLSEPISDEVKVKIKAAEKEA